MFFKKLLQNFGEEKDNHTQYTAVMCQNKVHAVISFYVKKIVCTLE